MSGPISLDSRRKWVLGLVNLAVVVVLWVLSSFLVNDIFEKNLYRKPFLITYLNTGSFIFYLLPFLIKNKFDYHRLQADLSESLSAVPSTVDEEEQYGSSDEFRIQTNDKLISLRETIKLSAQFCIIWYAANLTTNASLSYTSVGSQTILSSTSSFFTLIIGYLVSIERINKKKVIALILSFFGVVLITKTDSNSSDDSANTFQIFFGNCLALAGALCYGIYTILLKYKVRDESNMNMKVFFGFVGLFNLILIWPSLVLFHYLDIERFEWPDSAYIWKVLIINGSLTFISDFCWAKAMLLTSPLTVTVGLSFTIPIAMFGDLLFKQVPMSFFYVLGAVVVCVSFFIINNDEEADTINE